MTKRATILVPLAPRPGAGLAPAAAQEGAACTFDARADRVSAVTRNAGRCTVTVERRLYKEERIKTDDRSVEKRILDEIGRSL